MQVLKMRLIRQKYAITRLELGAACGLSPQRISEIELKAGGMTPVTRQKLRRGFYDVAAQRKASLLALYGDLSRHGSSLFDTVEEAVYEL